MFSQVLFSLTYIFFLLIYQGLSLETADPRLTIVNIYSGLESVDATTPTQEFYSNDEEENENSLTPENSMQYRYYQKKNKSPNSSNAPKNKFFAPKWWGLQNYIYTPYTSSVRKNSYPDMTSYATTPPSLERVKKLYSPRRKINMNWNNFKRLVQKIKKRY